MSVMGNQPIPRMLPSQRSIEMVAGIEMILATRAAAQRSILNVAIVTNVVTTSLTAGPKEAVKRVRDHAPRETPKEREGITLRMLQQVLKTVAGLQLPKTPSRRNPMMLILKSWTKVTQKSSLSQL